MFFFSELGIFWEKRARPRISSPQAILNVFLFFNYLFIWLCWVLGAAHRIFIAECRISSCSMQTHSWGTWDLVP